MELLSGRNGRRRGWLVFCLALLVAPVSKAEPVFKDWSDVLEHTPYWMSQGVYDNIITIRKWVLGASAYCEEPNRHILYDRRGRFLGYISNAEDRAATQARLNRTRAALVESGKSDLWLAGQAHMPGYPFALSCDQPHVDLSAAIARYLGRHSDNRLWGSWDDLEIGDSQAPVSLHDTLRYVYDTRSAQQRLQLPKQLPRYLAGKLLIESGAQTRAHSSANARGIMQLSPEVLADCGIAERNHWHRMAQIDCALRLLNQNARNMHGPFMDRFGELPEEKRQRLFTLLLIQAYHGGAARVVALLADEALSAPAAYFASHHGRFSAGDIAFGMVFHNLGRNRLGLASLYYVADVEIAIEALCRQRELKDDPFCSGLQD